MGLGRRIASLFRRRPPTAEELEAEAEAQRVRYEMDTIRASQRGSAGQNYQSGRGSRH
jgi:hypothetical protein